MVVTADQTTREAGAGSEAPTTSAPTSIPRWAWFLATGVVAALIRAWLSADRVAFSNPDEARYLAMARALGGEIDWSTGGLTYQPEISTLIAPIHWVTSDPETVHRLALLVNAVLGGGLAVLLAMLAAKITRVSVAWCSAAALLAACVPGTVAQTTWATPEVLAAVLFAAVLLATVRLVEHPGLARGLVLTTLFAASYVTHARQGLLVPSTLAVLAWLVYRRRLSIRDGVVLAGTLIVLTALAHQYSSWVIDQTWVLEAEDSRLDSVLDRALRVVAILQTTLGMTWYQLVTTLGVVGLGAGVALAALSRRVTATGLVRRDAAVIAVHTLPVAALSAVFMSGRDDGIQRVAQMVYGRYWEVIAPPLVMLGVLHVVAAGRPELRRAVGWTVGSNGRDRRPARVVARQRPRSGDRGAWIPRHRTANPRPRALPARSR